MIRAVNRRTLEVRFPESGRFEKAVVFLRADVPSDEGVYSEDMEEELRRYLSAADMMNGIGRKGERTGAETAARVLEWLFRLSVIFCTAFTVITAIYF